MYESVKKPKLKSNRVLWTAIIAASLVILAAVLIILWPFEYMDNFQAFVSDLSNSTVSSYNSPTGLWAETEAGSIRIIGDNIHKIYFVLSNAGVGRLCSVPEEAPMAVLTYADGGVMRLWDVEPINSTNSRTYNLCVSYTNPEGETYTYNHDHLDMSRLPLTERENLPQKMKDKLKEEAATEPTE